MGIILVSLNWTDSVDFPALELGNRSIKDLSTSNHKQHGTNDQNAPKSTQAQFKVSGSGLYAPDQNDQKKLQIEYAIAIPLTSEP